MKPTWLYNEMVSRGTDYTDLNTVKAYDEKMQKVRDIDAECSEIISQLSLSGVESVLEFGSATGEFALRASAQCETFYAVDVSPAMLAYSRLKADNHGIKNIKFFNAGFLTYHHADSPVDAVVSQLTLHHIPDFWKEVALARVYQMLKPNGLLYLKDTVYSFRPNEYQQFFNHWISETPIEPEIETHIREEFSTTGEVMEVILKRAGFTLKTAKYEKGYLATYLCAK